MPVLHDLQPNKRHELCIIETKCRLQPFIAACEERALRETGADRKSTITHVASRHTIQAYLRIPFGTNGEVCGGSLRLSAQERLLRIGIGRNREE